LPWFYGPELLASRIDSHSEPQNYPPPPEALRRLRLRSFWLFFGPGAIVACVTIGSGETVFASRGGAIFGYALLWCFVLSALVKAVQVYSATRFMVLTGAHPLESWAKMPGPKNWLVWFMAMVAIAWMPFWLGGGLPRMLGDFMNSLLGSPDADAAQRAFFGRIWGTVFIVVAITMTLVQGYGFLEKAQTAMVAILLVCMLVAAATCHPDFAAMLNGIVTPRIPEYEEWIKEFPKIAKRDRLVEVVVYLGAIGGGTQDYLGYLGMMREKGWGMIAAAKAGPSLGRDTIDGSPENIRRARSWMRAPQLDTGISFGVMLIFTLCFAVLGAAILHPQQIVPEGSQLLTHQADFLVRPDQSEFLQSLLVWVYRTGVFFAIFGTIYGAYELYTRTIRECLTAAIPRLRSVPLVKFRIATVLWCGIPGLLLLWLTTKDPVAILTPAAIVSSTFGCGVWCFAMLWSDKKHLPQALRMPVALRVGVIFSAVVLSVLGVVAFYKQYF